MAPIQTPLAHDNAEDEAASLRMSEAILARDIPERRYVVERELARGGMGVVNVVRDQDLRRISAMKVIPPQLLDPEARYRAFVEEARVTAQLEHPNIVPIHEIGIFEESKTPYYCMKLVEGEPLSEIIHQLSLGNAAYKRTYTRHALLDIFRKVCQAIAYAHSKGIIHRDIKPENIMVGQFGEVLVMDWGLAKYAGDEELVAGDTGHRDVAAEELLKTQDGLIKGSPAYMSPEQAIADLDEIDHQTDIFLLGATLYHIFTFAPPYAGQDLIEMVQRAEVCDHPSPRERRPDGNLPMALERIMLKAMAPVKANRFNSVTELIDEIDAFIAGRRVCGRRVFAAGEHLIEGGQSDREAYVIISGSAEVFREFNGRKIPIATLGPGEIIGEMSGISHKVRSADVKALETTHTLVITHDVIMEELEKLPPWLEQIVFSLVERVRAMDECVHPFLVERRLFPVLNQIYLMFLAADVPRMAGVELSFTVTNVVDEVVMNLGIDRNYVEQVISRIIAGNMCALTESYELVVSDLTTLGLFVDYCRNALETRSGARDVATIQVPDDHVSQFRSALRRLRTIDNAAETTDTAP